ncbi:MAG: RsmD family RNA methyltransferase [Deltaproteobacteria bacterium]|jgi:16S rRNA (guanine966-N2)-methyltransferase|nr:RsmD family RNA methyltransferase [Deltaproteobacteria bacterium]
MALSIIAGLKRGLKLESPPPATARPTAAMVREALFSMIAGRIPGARTLDLYAGSGAMGLEAASRGAASVLLCDRDPEVLRTLRRNASRFGEGFAVSVAELSFPEGFPALGRHAPFDLMLLDPPYAEREAPLEFLREAPGLGLAAPGALLVWEMAPATLKALPSLDTGSFSVTKTRAWGARAAAILEYEG